MKIDHLFLVSFSLATNQKCYKIYKLNQYQPILIATNKQNEPIVKYCMVMNHFSKPSDSDIITDDSELIYTWKKRNKK